MNNLDTLATLGTQDTGQRQTKHRTLKTSATRHGVWNQVFAKGKQFLSLIRRQPSYSYHLYIPCGLQKNKYVIWYYSMPLSFSKYFTVRLVSEDRKCEHLGTVITNHYFNLSILQINSVYTVLLVYLDCSLLVAPSISLMCIKYKKEFNDGPFQIYICFLSE
jgi:hypothetical protein